MQIDDEFEDKRGSEYGGRRASDAPTVPLRDHLETLIRGVRTELHLEITDVATKLDELGRECRESAQENRALTQLHYEEGRTRFHKLIAEVAALRLNEERRAGEKDARVGLRGWVQWLPGVLAAAAAVYVAFHG